MSEIDQQVSQNEAAVAEGTAYETIKRRLEEQGEKLELAVRELNTARLSEFGASEMAVEARTRVRTENNTIPRDLVQVGEYLLFGYNVYIGLRRETQVSDVFALFKLNDNDGEHSLEACPTEGTFLADPDFVNAFNELYLYYKNARLLQTIVKDGKLLAGFQMGERMEDIRVFRWSVSADGKEVRYIDNRGERDIQLPPSHDFEWTQTVRENTVHGRFPHINILDKVFVETLDGSLTLKIENNTEDGRGIFSEPVEDETQSIDDAEIFYAGVGDLVLLKIRPYREENYRYLIFNSLTSTVTRVDAIGESCVQLPEDHGIIFPGGYYLQTGEFKTFDDTVDNLRFRRQRRSPNGEDVLYVFYEREKGVIALLAYNLIEKSIQNPIYASGYALADDGTLVVFSAESEPTRVHPMQIWNTPFVSEEYASTVPPSQTFYGRIGNAELVRGISELYSIVRMIKRQEVSAQLYEELATSSSKLFDQYYWLESDEVSSIATVLKQVADTSELVIDEFEKVKSIREQSSKALDNALTEQQQVLREVHPENWDSAEQYVQALDKIRHQRGHLITIKELRYIDVPRIEQLEEELVAAQDRLSQQTVDFLSSEGAFAVYDSIINDLDDQVEKADTRIEIVPLLEEVEQHTGGLDLLSEVMASINIEDANVRTDIVDAVSNVYARLNQTRARADQKRKNLGSEEATKEFGAQFKLFSQSVTNALGLSDSPDRCDEQLSRLLIQLEELESQFSEFDRFLADIMEKREEVYEAFESHKQQLLEERQRKAQTVFEGAERMLASIERRTQRFADTDELNTYLASDALVLKVRESVGRLNELESSVQAGEVEAKLKALADNAFRALQDKADIFEEGGNIIKFGRHRFSVNTQELDLTMLPRDGQLSIHLTGTNFFEPLESQELIDLKPYWEVSLDSENDKVYRAEYLALLVLTAAERGDEGLSRSRLREAMVEENGLADIVRDFAAPRYKEGYQKGIHDHDATIILDALLTCLEAADLLSYAPLSRGFAQIYWANLIKPLGSTSRLPMQGEFEELSGLPATWQHRAQSVYLLQETFNDVSAIDNLTAEIDEHMAAFLDSYPIEITDVERRQAAAYLTAELGRERLQFAGSQYAQQIVDEFKRALQESQFRTYQDAQDRLRGEVAERWKLGTSWLKAMLESRNLEHLMHYLPEAVAMLNAEERIERRASQVDLEIEVEGLLGDHPRVENGKLAFSLDNFLLRLREHREVHVPAYHRYLHLRQEAIDQARERLRIQEFKPRPLSSFVRNRLINESYLPIIGDNLAKQMGTAGDKKRTDLMGLLMMISPPGYGKTTLMEYVANRLGLIFMKINCPALGHDVSSLDPSKAPNATAAQELEKLNLSLEMGNNVMLYLDDIQHTHPEFLQKFISLCDGTRRIEGVWRGKVQTYDMRGRRFCVVMAGNPYTESGEVFKVPDMLANRADIYNLGDILGGMEEVFALSYIENSLTSNPVLAPLSTREMEDVYRFVGLAKGETVSQTDFSHQYSSAESNEITGVLKKLFVIQDIILKINQQYIASAAQDDRYRTEPSFKLQGSYRNMNKLAEKVSTVMNDEELSSLISDHYLGESQLLTQGAEENLLKLAELRGDMTEEQQTRWDQIKSDFLRNKAMGGDDSEVGNKVVAQLVDLVSEIRQLGSVSGNQSTSDSELLAKSLERLRRSMAQIAKSVNFEPDVKLEPKVEVQVNSPPIPGLEEILGVLADTWQNSLYPLVYSMDKKIDIDLKTQKNIADVSNQLKALEKQIKASQQQSD